MLYFLQRLTAVQRRAITTIVIYRDPDALYLVVPQYRSYAEDLVSLRKIALVAELSTEDDKKWIKLLQNPPQYELVPPDVFRSSPIIQALFLAVVQEGHPPRAKSMPTEFRAGSELIERKILQSSSQKKGNP